MKKKAKRYKENNRRKIKNKEEHTTIRKRKTQKTRKKKALLLLVALLFIISMIFSGKKILNWLKDNKNNKKLYNDTNDLIYIDNTKENSDKDKYAVDFNKLLNQNKDTVGWIKVNGTQIEYPIVKKSDNSYYLTHSFDKSYNSAGWIFADYRNKLDGTDKNIVIYGHNRRDGSMFGSLKNVLNDEWLNNEENRKILFFILSEKNVYEVFSIYKVEKEDYYIQTNFTKEKYSDFLKKIKGRSIKNFNVELTENDQILTLSTCDNNNKYRLVVHAKKCSN